MNNNILNFNEYSPDTLCRSAEYVYQNLLKNVPNAGNIVGFSHIIKLINDTEWEGDYLDLDVLVCMLSEQCKSVGSDFN